MLRCPSVFGDTLPVCLRGTGSHFIFPVSAVRACLAELGGVFVFKGAWFALTFRVLGLVASVFYNFIILTDAAEATRRQLIGRTGVVYTIIARLAQTVFF